MCNPSNEARCGRVKRARETERDRHRARGNAGEMGDRHQEVKAAEAGRVGRENMSRWRGFPHFARTEAEPFSIEAV